MIHGKLLAMYHRAAEWCRAHRVSFDVVCDESDVQGILLFKRDQSMCAPLHQELTRFAEETGVHLRRVKVRGGTVFLTSLKSVNEGQLKRLRALAEQAAARPYAERLTDALSGGVLGEIKPMPVISFVDSLRQRAVEIAVMGEAKQQPPAISEPLPDPNRVSKFSVRRELAFRQSLAEALDGLATPTGAQPVDLFKMFANAMQVLGQKMNVGPLQDKLKERGIKWKLSDDRQSIVFYVINGTTNAPQPIATLTSESLNNPGEFEEQLTSMIDFAKGRAPGTEKANRERVRSIEQTVRDIAKAAQPQQPDPDKAAMSQLMRPASTGAPPAPAAAPAAPAAAPAAPGPAAAPAKPAGPPRQPQQQQPGTGPSLG